MQRVPQAALALSMRTRERHSHSINSAEDRTPHEPSFATCMRLTSRSTYSGCGLCTLTAFCVTVATSCELVAIVDHDGQGINSAGARTPHELLSMLLMRSACTGCAGAITLMSAHWQRVGRRPGPPLNAARSAVKAGACAESCISRTLMSQFCVWGSHKVMQYTYFGDL